MGKKYSTGWQDVCFTVEHLTLHGSVFEASFLSTSVNDEDFKILLLTQSFHGIGIK